MKSLFTQLNLEEIKKKQDENRKKIEGKKEELRHLVVTRYRDLIDSADSIVQMKRVSEEFITSLEEAEQIFKAFYHPPIPEAKPQASQNVQNQVQILSEFPEKIWTALDDHDSYQATICYFQAQSFLKDISSSKEMTLNTKLQRLGSQFEQFPKLIIQHAEEFLSMKRKISSRKCASLLTSILVLECNGKDAFQKFLTMQFHLCENILEKGIAQLEVFSLFFSSEFFDESE